MRNFLNAVREEYLSDPLLPFEKFELAFAMGLIIGLLIWGK